MSQSSHNNRVEVLLVAMDNRREQFSGELAHPSANVKWYSNVFDAAAAVSKSLSDGSAHWRCKAYIMIDCLDRIELEIFSCLAQLPDINTVAVSAVQNRQKMNYAKLLGADQVIMFSELPRLLSAAGKTSRLENFSQTIGAPPNNVDQNFLEELLEPPFESADTDGIIENNSTAGTPPLRKGPGKAPQKKSFDPNTLLSAAELESLLG